ncbi:MAG: AmmeMemoRadiSam system protein A [Treponema sp.]|jgi:AmmeMemoRadiSam system protein A|nr:AmmeMemoRadiSam system protein A [Treponema sp.]
MYGNVPRGEFSINGEEKRTLLADARETIAAKLENRKPEYRRSPKLAAAIEGGNSALSMSCGAFVTIHTTGGQGTGDNRRLRGCIGRMAAPEPLEKTIRVMAVEAAFGDPRFPPLSPEELPRCELEISVLSPMERCPNPRQVKVGVHGLYLSCHGRTGVLLPQVPVEQGWNLDEYLDYICVKAGVPAKAYEAPDAELFTFTAVVFGEE